MSDISIQPLTKLADMIADRDIGALELFDHYAARIEAHNGALNAVVAMDLDAGRDAAKRADEDPDGGPLHGLPMTIKDAFEVEGMVSTGGMVQLKEYVPAQDAAAVARLREAGANIFGKTNVPAFSGDWQSYNDIYGVTNNPWNVACTPGGSSGGAAAVISAGLAAGDIGSDIGGSIRLPAHFCGLFGHKPSFGVVPSRGHIPPAPRAYSTSDLSVAGPLGRSAADLELLFDILYGDPGDLMHPHPPLPRARAEAPGDLRVAVWLDEPDASTDEEVAASVRQAASALEDAGATVDRAARPDFTFNDNFRDYVLVLSAVISADFPPNVLEHFAELAGQVDDDDMSHAALQARGSVLTYTQMLGVDARRQVIKDAWHAFFQEFDVVLCPPASITAFPHDTEKGPAARRMIVNGEEAPYFDMLHWASLATFAHLPATVAPVRCTDAGLPAGVQIIGGYLEDRTTMAVAGMLEDILGGYTPPPGFA